MSEDRIEGIAKQGVGRVQDAFGGLTGDDKTQAKGKLNEVAGSVQDTVGKVRDQAQDALSQAKGQAQDAYNQAKGQAKDTYADVESYLRDQPLVGLGVGVGLGLILGLALGGGRKTIYVRK